VIDHDRLFKELLTTFFTDFLDLFLPELSAYLDRSSIVFLDKEVFTDVTAGTRHQADLVAKASFRGQASFFLLHLEHQAQAQAEFSRRMFAYFSSLHGKHHLPVYPIALFSHGSLQPEPDEYRIVFPDLDVLRFRYRVVQLSRLNWRDFVRQTNPVASALMARMGMAQEERPRVKLECLRLLVTLRLDPARMRLISGFIDTYLRLSEHETLLFQEQAATLLNETEQATVMELTTSCKEEGIEIGRREGRREGECELVLRILRKRWGIVPTEAVSAVGQLSSDQLEELAEASLDFKSVEDLKNWLAAQ
jgi:hypothetical protein